MKASRVKISALGIETISCCACKQDLSRDAFGAMNRKPYVQAFCKECRAKKWTEYDSYQKQLAKNKNYSKSMKAKDRIEALLHYSNPVWPVCACCKEARIEFLAIDHINGGGNQHRKSEGISSMSTWLRRNNWPEGYQVLCHNCNLAKGFYGKCPHEQRNGTCAIA